METPNLETLNTFSIDTLPNLDVAVLGALELFQQTTLPSLKEIPFKRPLVIGSVNAHITGRIMFDKYPALFADENSYATKLQLPDIDGAILISASGGKHAIQIAQALKEEGIETYLITNNEDAPARDFILSERILVFPKNREPYTYNTSTYLGMILAATGENPKTIFDFIMTEFADVIPQNLGEYNAFTIVIPSELALMRGMFITKFDELFGPRVVGRVFTTEEIKHAKTVVHSDSELFILLGADVSPELCQGSTILPLSLPADARYGALMAAGYYAIGSIQKQHPPYFKDAIVRYTETTSKVFGQQIDAIVE